MDLILAAELLHVGKKPITRENIISLFEILGASYVVEEVENLVSSLKEKSIDEFITEGKKIMATAVIASAPAQTSQKTEKSEAKKEVEKEKPKQEEEADDFDIFSGF